MKKLALTIAALAALQLTGARDVRAANGTLPLGDGTLPLGSSGTQGPGKGKTPPPPPPRKPATAPRPRMR